MSLKKQIEQDLKVAIRAQNKDEIRALRGIKSMILLSETEKGSSGELSEEVELRLLSKAAKQRKDSAQLFADQGREDLASIEKSELTVINKYLPYLISLYIKYNTYPVKIKINGLKKPKYPKNLSPQ